MKIFAVVFAMMVLPCTAMGADLIPGTTSTYTEGGYTWAGNPGCYAAGFLLQPTSEAIDNGALIPDFHCPAAGPSSQLNSNGSPCVEWYGKAPDIGACEYVSTAPLPPVASSVVAVLLKPTGEDIAGASQEGADGIPDEHIMLTGVPAPITRVRISAVGGGGTWETPLTDSWIVAIHPQADPSVVDLYFNYWTTYASYMVDLTFANQTSQSVQTTQAVPTIPQQPSGLGVQVGARQ